MKLQYRIREVSGLALNVGIQSGLIGGLTRDFEVKFFYKWVSPGPLSVPLGPFRFFLKIRGDIRKSMFIGGVNDTGDKRENFEV
jgi:hypothetical protein